MQIVLLNFRSGCSQRKMQNHKYFLYDNIFNIIYNG
jgi:hypothetical protein